MQPGDLIIETLGPRTVLSPLAHQQLDGFHFIDDAERILFNTLYNEESANGEWQHPLSMEMAGPREKIYFDPSKTTAAIVTCGGICPGINNVIRSLVMTLHYRYGVHRILGVQYGYQGFIAKYKHPFVDMTPTLVSDIHQFGGTILGSSRGQQNIGEMVDCLERNGINILFTIGGDGTLRGANKIAEEIKRRKLKISVVGIPKTIDNDINHIEKTFGFETSFTIASPIIRDAHNEAQGAYNGIAIVKLMGRDSGFIAANAALAMPEVNLVLVPEIEFDLNGENGLLEIIRKRLEKKHHCLIVVAEGAGQSHFQKTREIDASGNILYNDIGIFLKNEIRKYFEEIDMEAVIKYIDPSYIIRSAPANPSDSIFCNKLGISAVHAAMAGKSNLVVGRRNNAFIHLPIELVIQERKKINVKSDLWINLLETTGQPINMKNPPKSKSRNRSRVN